MAEFSFFDLTHYGQGGFDMYRVPGIIVTGEGDVLVYYEARQKDPSQRALLCRRSQNEGKSFGEAVELVFQKSGVMLHNPLMIAGKNNEVFLFWNEDYLRLYMKKSVNGGRNWGETIELTPVVEGWRSVWPLTLFAVAPGHGIRLKNGTLVVPLWLSRGENAHNPACFATLYSADNGVSWQRSSLVKSTAQVIDPTEGALAELEDGRLLATIRHAAQTTRRRAFVRGTAAQWDEVYLEESLPDPICAGSLLRLATGEILFSNCACGDEACLAQRKAGSDMRFSKDARRRLTVRKSKDEGVSFSEGTEIAFEGGYSDLAQSKHSGFIYCFYERGWVEGNCIFNKHLTFARFTPDLIR